MTLAPEPYAGEALWEANTQAGRIVKNCAGIPSDLKRLLQIHGLTIMTILDMI